MEYKPTSGSAIEFAQTGQLEEWIQNFLRGEGNNLGFADGLKLAPRIYHAPKNIPLSKFSRVCGPEEGLKWQIDENGFNWRVGKIMERYENEGWDMPPLIINCQDGIYELNDGNHRFEALSRLGIKNHWVVFWETIHEE